MRAVRVSPPGHHPAASTELDCEIVYLTAICEKQAGVGSSARSLSRPGSLSLRGRSERRRIFTVVANGAREEWVASKAEKNIAIGDGFLPVEQRPVE